MLHQTKHLYRFVKGVGSLLITGILIATIIFLLQLPPQLAQANALQAQRLASSLAPFNLTAHTPVTNAVGVAVDTNITATFDADVATASVVSTSFAAHTQFGGLLTGSFSVTGDTITLDPNRALFAGEQVQVIATADIESTGAMTLTNPTQWGFTAGPIKTRCDVIAFENIGTTMPGLINSSVAWGDYDSDGDLDVLASGLSGGTRQSRVYNNNAGTFTDIGAGLIPLFGSAVDWGDYDNDGDLDILLAGRDSSNISHTKIYENDNGTFTDIGAGLTGVFFGTVDWGDYDNDGDLDIIVSGTIYENDNGSFTNIGAGLPAVTSGTVKWGDYDNDGDLDVLATGNGNASVYENNAGMFTDITAGLTGVSGSASAWGDYDNDGDLDILVTGLAGGTRTATVYENDAGMFTDISAGLTGVNDGAVAWGDYDNDGDLDILLTGFDQTSIKRALVYRNNAGTFTNINAGLTGVRFGAVVWGDYDNDDDLDILLTGDGATAINLAVYRNDCTPTANDDSYVTVEKIPLTVSLPANGVLNNDTDPDGLALSAQVVMPVTNGTLDLNFDGTFSYTPTLNFSGVVSFTYSASNGNQSDIATATIHVNPAADAPVANDDNFATTIDTPLSVSLLANDFDPNGDPLTIIFDTNPTLGTLVPDFGAWSKSAVDTVGDVGQFTSLAEINGQPAISYYDQTNGDLKYATFDGSNWISTTVDSAGNFGKYTSLAEIAGQPAISYYNQTDQMLKYAAFDGSNWISTTVDATGYAGLYTSLAEINGQPAISYYGNGDLKYAAFDGSNWVVNTLDFFGYVGLYTSLVEVNGQPAISYADMIGALYYASFDGSNWTYTLVDDNGTVGLDTSLAVINGQPAISYADVTNDALKYARFDGSQWISTTVDSGVYDVGRYTSLIEVNGQPAISYRGGIYDLKYATFDGAMWSTISVDVAGDVGYYTSMAMVNGQPSISYYDYTNRDLKYAELELVGYAYLPPTDQCGIDTFTYHVNDGVYDSNTATVMIDISGCPPIGGLTGSVVNDVAAPVTGAEVSLYQNVGSVGFPQWQLRNVTTTDGSGAYGFAKIDTDFYAIFVTDPNHVYAAEYYENAKEWDAVTPISVTNGVTTTGITVVLDGASVLTGTVTLSDMTPLAGIRVSMLRENAGIWQTVRTVTTDINGNYSVNGLIAGDYRLYFVDHNGVYGSEYYEDKADFNSATIVSVATNVTVGNINAVLGEKNPVLPVLPNNVMNGCGISIDENGQWVIPFRTIGPRCIAKVQTPPGMVSCPNPDTPTNVRFVVDTLPPSNSETPLTENPVGSGQYGNNGFLIETSLNQAAVFRIEWDCGGNPQTIDVGHAELIDPSGFITDVETGEFVAGATVTLFQVPDWQAHTSPLDVVVPNMCESHLSKASGANWSQPAPTHLGVFAPTVPMVISPTINPQVTGGDGYYGWDVIAGCWYVTVEAEGYLDLVSPVVGVPTEVTDLDLQLTPFTVGVDAANGADDDLDLSWMPDPTTGCSYAVYQSTLPYFFAPDEGMVVATTGLLAATIDGVTGDTATNYFFQIVATDCVDAGSSVSNTVGEFDFAIVPGN